MSQYKDEDRMKNNTVCISASRVDNLKAVQFAFLICKLVAQISNVNTKHKLENIFVYLYTVNWAVRQLSITAKVTPDRKLLWLHDILSKFFSFLLFMVPVRYSLPGHSSPASCGQHCSGPWCYHAMSARLSWWENSQYTSSVLAVLITSWQSQTVAAL